VELLFDLPDELRMLGVEIGGKGTRTHRPALRPLA
jgi:hypothetical protein